jgi:hypothetical protein
MPRVKFGRRLGTQKGRGRAKAAGRARSRPALRHEYTYPLLLSYNFPFSRWGPGLSRSGPTCGIRGVAVGATPQRLPLPRLLLCESSLTSFPGRVPPRGIVTERQKPRILGTAKAAPGGGHNQRGRGQYKGRDPVEPRPSDRLCGYRPTAWLARPLRRSPPAFPYAPGSPRRLPWRPRRGT